ncbi:MAG: hypothetical protein AAFN77_19860 [Planctomycetota bacterium]
MQTSNGETTSAESMLVCRHDRDVVAEATRQWLEQKIDSSCWYEVISKFEESSDPTVKQLVSVWWFDADELSVGALTKTQWDLFQRWLLVLDSDRTLQTTSTAVWSHWQLCSLAGTVTFLVAALAVGWWTATLILGLPLSVLSYWISNKRSRPEAPYAGSIEPFGSFSSLRGAYESTPWFEKMRFPFRRRKLLSDRANAWRRRIAQWIPRPFWRFQSIFFWVFVFPSHLFLPFQMAPVLDHTIDVVPVQRS